MLYASARSPTRTRGMYTPSGQMFMRRIIVGVSLFKKWTTTTDTNCGFVKE